QHGPQPNDRVATETTAFILDNASALVSHQAPELVQFFGQSLNFAQSLIPSSVERAQLRILSESLIPQKQLEAYLSLQWSVIVRDKGTFILGDIGPIISCDERLETVSPLARQKDLKLVLLPISDRHLLIGSQLENPPILDPDTLNIGIAELSREFF